MKKPYIVLLLLGVFASCTESLPVIEPEVRSEKTDFDSDDPAIWIHPEDPSKSIIFGTDKDTQGGIYAFDLNGRILTDKTIKNVQRPNNVDIEYGFRLGDTTLTDIMVFTERERQQVRVYSVPDMRPLDNGGIPVFVDETDPERRLPMGIALYKSPVDSTVYMIVGRKSGPLENYLYQYELSSDKRGLKSRLVRKFGKFSGTKEIEAIAVDDALGHIYYSDEGVCIRKYHAEPDQGDEEIDCFGGEHFKEDIEGIALAKTGTDTGYLIVSDQQRGQFNLFSRKDNAFVKAVNLGTRETDGCEVVTSGLNDTFPGGLFVAMNDERDFFFYDLRKILEAQP